MLTSNTEALGGIDVLSVQVAELIPADPNSELREHYIGQLDAIGSAAAETELAVLQDLCLVFQSLLQELVDQNREATDEETSLLLEWPALLMSYIESPQDPSVCGVLSDYFSNPYWITPLSEDDAEALGQMLMPESFNNAAISGGLTEDQEDIGDVSAINKQALDFSDQANLTKKIQTLTSEQQELVDLLIDELNEIIEADNHGPISVVSGQTDPGARRSMLEAQTEEVERIGSAAEMVGLEGLHRVGMQIQRNLQLFTDRCELPLVKQVEGLLRDWPKLMHGYLQNIHDRSACKELVNCLQSSAWAKPLSAEDGMSLIELLAEAAVVAEDEGTEPRQTKARPEDVSLDIPEDVNKELLDSLLQELPSHTTGFSAAIQRAIEGEFLSDIDVAQRIAHTLKGAGNVVGVRGITNLTHHLEDILVALSKHNAMPPPALGETLISAADCLEGMSDALLGIDSAPQDAVQVFQDVLDWINLIECDGIADLKVNSTAKPLSQQTESLAAAGESVSKPDIDQRKTNSPETESSSLEAVLRIPAALAENLLRLAGEGMISNAQIQEKLKRSMEQAELIHRQNQLLQQLGLELEQLVDMRNLSSPVTVNTRSGDSAFDSLELNQYNELHTFTHRLLEAVTDSAELTQSLAAQLLALNGKTLEQSRLNLENQEAVMRTRMVPVSDVVPRLQRSLRQACRMTGKQAKLDVIGAATLIDTNVLNDLMNPLMHLLRNAVDHGIESSEQRLRSGKDAIGSINLKFSRRGDQILVYCEDDGGGLDYETIKRKAQERGLFSAGASPSQQELNHILLAPGFSTRDSISQVSGRGIGMDAVHDCIKGMKGSLSVNSERGHGTIIELSIPVTLLSTHAIFVRVRRHIVAIANRGVDEMLAADAGTSKDIGSKKIYRLGNALYESEYLDTLLNLPPDRRSGIRKPYSLLLVRRDNGSKKVVLVQEILDTRDIVVKPLGKFAPKIDGIIGATILGDGEVAPVIDLTELLNTSSAVPVQSTAETSVKAARQDLPLALVVDDSLSARRLLAQFVQDIGYQVRTAKDGMEAVAIIEKQSPDIVLADLEMPRMNGLELTSHVRMHESTCNIPVIMITSRSTEKHRQQADKAGVNYYMTKPFAEDELAKNISACLERV